MSIQDNKIESMALQRQVAMPSPKKKTTRIQLVTSPAKKSPMKTKAVE